MYLEYKAIKKFEDKIGYQVLIDKNIQIGKFLNFEPVIEYAVCSKGACCYSPKNVSSQYSDWRSQKAECERWLADNLQRFPDGWVAKENYQPTRLEYYPNFHKDWNHLMEAIKRLRKNGYQIAIDPDDIFFTWQLVSEITF